MRASKNCFEASTSNFPVNIGDGTVIITSQTIDADTSANTYVGGAYGASQQGYVTKFNSVGVAQWGSLLSASNSPVVTVALNPAYSNLAVAAYTSGYIAIIM